MPLACTGLVEPVASRGLRASACNSAALSRSMGVLYAWPTEPTVFQTFGHQHQTRAVPTGSSFTRSARLARKTKIVPLNGSAPIDLAHQRCQAFHTLARSHPAASPQEPAPSPRRQSRHCLEGLHLPQHSCVAARRHPDCRSPELDLFDRHRRHDSPTRSSNAS